MNFCIEITFRSYPMYASFVYRIKYSRRRFVLPVYFAVLEIRLCRLILIDSHRQKLSKYLVIESQTLH